MWRRYSIALLAGAYIFIPAICPAGNGANFVLYNHHTAESGEMEVMIMNDLGEGPDGTRYAAQMIEFEAGLTDRWTAEFMVEGQATFGQSGYNFTGFRIENRYRPFEYGAYLNPVLYIEYEDLSEDTKYLMEVAGREDAAETVKRRTRERVLESRIILGQDIGDGVDVAFNWLNESDLDTGITSFGYALGINLRLSAADYGEGDDESFSRRIVLGVELFGALGNSGKGITIDDAITQHYLSPNVLIYLGDGAKLKFGGAIGLTNVSHDIFRIALGYEF